MAHRGALAPAVWWRCLVLDGVLSGASRVGGFAGRLAFLRFCSRRGDAEAVRPLDSSSLFRTIETCWNDCELRMSRGVSEVSVFSVPLGPANGIIFISGGGGNVRPCVWRVQPPLFCTCPVQSHSRAVIPVRKPLERGGAFLMGKSYRMRLSRG